MSWVITRDPRKWLSTALLLAMGLGAACAEQQGSGTQAQTKPERRRPHDAIYAKAGDPQKEVAKVSARARKENKRILLMFGYDSCGWCHKLHDLFESNREIQKTLSNEYVLVMIDITTRNAESFLGMCKAALSQEEQKKGVGYPFLAVLDADAKVVKAQPTDALEEGDHHDPKRVLDFLTLFKAAPRDARAFLDEVLSRAAPADKRVFLTFGAPWCGWCHKLENWLAEADVAAILDRDFIVTKIDIDRMTGGKEVMMQYRSSNSGGIPWYTVLDPKGTSLATADGPDGNIGYPAEPKEIDQFMAIVKSQSRRLDEPQLEKLRRSLVGAAERIQKDSRH
jgi:thioredoxin-related protein